MSDDYKTLRLSILSQTKIFSRPNGSTLYSVEAVDDQGNLVPDLRTFAEKLPIQEEQGFKVKRYTHPEHGTTWTILDPSGGPGKTSSDVERRLEDLEKRMKAMEDRIDPQPQREVHPAQEHLGDAVRGPDFYDR